MVRILAILVGAFFSLMLAYSAVLTMIGMVAEPVAATAEEEFHLHPKHVKFSSDGIFGKFDRPQLQRGFQVYKEVCASCHGLKQIAFRDLADLGYSEGQIKTIASEWPIEAPSLNPETGEAATRKPLASDKIPSSYPNEIAARAANNNAMPPDLSLMTKARHDGTAYLYSLLTGYQEPKAELLKKFPEAKPSGALHHNPYFANLNIAMPPPLVAEGQVSYGEGAPKATVDQMARDVAAFLTWTAEPKLENRRQAGFPTIIFLLFFALLSWMSYQNIWADKKKR
jgi:ubiquinol-cytochrome c reductase cytochrome c1 subunit